MADRYWVGGSGNWNDTARWAATSGGAGGQTVPTAADNAYFDDESDTGSAFTVTVNASSTCLNLIIGDGVTVDALDQTMTLAGSSALAISGSLFFPATNFSRTYSGVITLTGSAATKTINTNGIQLTTTDLIVNSSGSAYDLQSSLDVGNYIYIQAGTLNTNDYTLTGGLARTAQPGTATLNLGASTFNLRRMFVNSGITPITINPGTSLTIALSSFQSENEAIWAGATWNDFRFDCVEFRGQRAFEGATNLTFNNLTISPRTSTGTNVICIAVDLTVSGTLTINSGVTDPSRRVWLTSRRAPAYISSATNSGRATFTIANIDFGYGVILGAINFAGAATPIDLSSLYAGDNGFVSNVIFPTPKTVYWNLSGNQNFLATGWATTPTGTPAAINTPLLQDTAVITELGAATQINFNSLVGNLTFDDGINPRTSAVSVNLSSMLICGNIKFSSGVVMVSPTDIVQFQTGNVCQITSAGKSFPSMLSVTHNTGSLVLNDEMTIGNLQSRNFAINLNGNAFNANAYEFANASRVTVVANGGKFIARGSNTTIWETRDGAAGPQEFSRVTVECTYAGSTGTRTIRHIPVGWSAGREVSFSFVAGADTVQFSTTDGSSNIDNLNFTGFSGTFTPTNVNIRGSLTLSPSMTFTSNTNTLAITPTTNLVETIRTNGIAINCNLNISASGRQIRLEDNLTMAASRTLTLTSGTLNLNSRTVSIERFSTSNSNTRNITFGAAQLVLFGDGTVFDAATANGFTVTPNTGRIILSNNTTNARTFAGGGVIAYPELQIGGDSSTSTLTLTGANGFTKLSSTKQVAHTIVFPNAITRVANWDLNGSEGNLITLSRTGGSGTFTIQYTGNQYGIGRYLSISNSAATPANRMYAIFSTNGGNNTGWIFDAPRLGQFLSFFDAV
jgi:hypothetical protein